MIRGLYTAGSGMVALQHRMDALSNNLANVDTAAYKRDVSVFKAFPELLMRRTDDDGLRTFFLRQRHVGSFDTSPVVGTVGTGVEQNEVFTIFEQGSLKNTEGPFDVALFGTGFFAIDTPYGERYTRNGSFILDPNGYLVTKEGFPVLGEDGPLYLKKNNFVIDEDGKVFINQALQEDPHRLVDINKNRWEERVFLDRLKIVDFVDERYLRKQGSSMWHTTEESGPAIIAAPDKRPKVLQGFLETANVQPVVEMVRLIEVNRNYEANQKVIQTEDESTGQLLRDVLRV